MNERMLPSNPPLPSYYTKNMIIMKKKIPIFMYHGKGPRQITPMAGFQ